MTIADLEGAVAIRSGDRICEAVLAAAWRIGYEASMGLRGVPAAELPAAAPRLLWVNPTAADLLRLRWISWADDEYGGREAARS